MAADDGGSSFDDLDSIVLDDDFVRGAKIVELDAHPRRRPMPPAPPKPPAAPYRRSRRVHPAVIVAGVVAALALLWWLNTSVVTDPGPSSTAGPTTSGSVAGQTFVAGDCLTWPASEGEFATRLGLEVVPCADDHRMEMVGTIDLGDRPYTTADGFGRLFGERCPPLVRGHLGHDLDPAGRLEIGGLYPSIDSWRAGDHGLACAVVARGAATDGDDPLFRGAAADG